MNVTLYNSFAEAARCTPRAVAYHMNDVTLCYAELLAKTNRVALGMMDRFALEPGAHISLIADYCPHWLVASLAIQALGGVEFPLGPESDDRVLLDFFFRTECRYCFVADSALALRVKSLPLAWKDDIQLILLNEDGLFGPAEGSASEGALERASERAAERTAEQTAEQMAERVCERQRRLNTNDLAVVICSSGTTGPAKQAMLSHANFLHTITHVPERMGLSSGDVFLCCLPSWHLYSRLVAYTALACSCRLEFCRPDELAQAFERVRPMFFPSFPVVWIHIYHRFMDRLDAHTGLRQMFALCLNYSRTYYRQLDRARGCDVRHHPRPTWLAGLSRTWAYATLVLLYVPQQILNALVFRPIRRRLGGRLRTAIIGDAPLPLPIDVALRALGFRVLEGYGSSEQMIVSMRGLQSNVVGTVGQVLREIDLVLINDEGQRVPTGQMGEIAVSGPQVFLGYFRDEARTQAAFIELAGNRYYLTGDLGWIDFHGNLIVAGRKTSRIELAGGRTLYPELTESVLCGSRYVSVAIVFPVPGAPLLALLVPEYQALCRYYYRHQDDHHQDYRHPGREATELVSFPEEVKALDQYLCDHEDELRQVLSSKVVIELITREVTRFLKSATLEAHQIPTHFALSPTRFTRGRELTPTLKLRRSFIQENYSERLVLHALQIKPL